MKNKDIKKIMKQNIESHIPQSAPTIDFLFDQSNHDIEAIKKPRFNINLALATTLTVMMVIVGFLLFSNGGVNPSHPEFKFQNDEQILSFSAVSTLSLLSTMGENTLVSNITPMAQTNEDPIVLHLMPYLKSAEKIFLSDTGLNVITTDSTLPDYQYMMIFETKNLLNKISTYEMHYNLILESQDDEESEYQLSGILIQGQKEYQVIGEKEIEDDEEKLEFRAYLDETSYVESFYEIENDEQKFSYKVYQYGQLISESEFKIEYEDDEIKIELVFTEGSNSGIFEFEYVTEDEENMIKIKFDSTIDEIEISGEITVKMEIDPLNGDIIYHFLINPENDDSYEYDARDDEKDDDEDED